jgi:multiple sugar transport system substrate-binding protein
MYDPLYAAIPRFEAETSVHVEIVAQLPHPELNAFVKRTFESGIDGVDFVSTHTKYAPSQAQWLSALDELLPAEDEGDLLRRPAELSRIGGRLLQIPRNLDVRLLHYRRDLFEDSAEQASFERRFGRPLRVPHTWTELVDTAEFFTRDGFYGFLFPGRDSGLFGTFYEMLIGAGGDLFDSALRPAFDSSAGEWAAGLLAELHPKSRGYFARGMRQWFATGPGAIISIRIHRHVASGIGLGYRRFRPGLRVSGRLTLVVTLLQSLRRRGIGTPRPHCFVI